MADAVSVIQATLAPIFLVNGAAIFLNFTQARLFRVIDRLRGLAKELPDAEGEARARIEDERRRHVRRAILLRNAILFGILVIACTVLTTILILIPSGQAPIYSFTAALLSFAIALGLVVADAFLSVAAVRHLAREHGG